MFIKELLTSRKAAEAVGEGIPIRRGDIYFADLNEPFGAEPGFRRLVIALQNSDELAHSPTVIVAVVTQKTVPQDVPSNVCFRMGRKRMQMTAMLDKLLTIDKRRIIRFVDSCPSDASLLINEALRYSLGLDMWDYFGGTEKKTEGEYFE